MTNLYENLKAYRGSQPYVFISYAHLDKNVVLDIISQMQHDEYRVWFDEGIMPGSKFDPYIMQKLKDSHCLIIFTSESYWKSSYCMQELEYCIQLKKPMLIVSLDKAPVPETYSALNEDQHLFFMDYHNKALFYEKMYEFPILTETKNAGCAEVTDPKWKTVYNTSVIKDKPEKEMLYSDCCYFGSYPYTEDGKPEKILWRVIAREEDCYLLVSEYILDAKHFHNTLEPVDWESSDIRTWLNDYFYQQSFTEEEKSLICQKENRTLPNRKCITDSVGGSSKDYVFLLSYEEIYQYFARYPEAMYHQSLDYQPLGTCEFLKADYTPYGRTRTSYENAVNGAGWWWLRTSGANTKMAVQITSTPEINIKGVTVQFPPRSKTPAGGIRPAVWIKVNTEGNR